jgi:hypothetical protein
MLCQTSATAIKRNEEQFGGGGGGGEMKAREKRYTRRPA